MKSADDFGPVKWWLAVIMGVVIPLATLAAVIWVL